MSALVYFHIVKAGRVDSWIVTWCFESRVSQGNAAIVRQAFVMRTHSAMRRVFSSAYRHCRLQSVTEGASLSF